MHTRIHTFRPLDNDEVVNICPKCVGYGYYHTFEDYPNVGFNRCDACEATGTVDITQPKLQYEEH